MLEIYWKTFRKGFWEACASNIPAASVFVISFFFILLGADELLCKMLHNYRVKFDHEST